MRRHVRTLSWAPLCAWAVLAAVAGFSQAAPPPRDPSENAKPPASTVEIFAGIESHALEVRLIAGSSAQCRLLVRNATDQPINVQLPEAMAAVPVLAQLGFPFPGNPGQGGNQGGSQALGLGNPMGQQNQNPGMFLFSIPPERTRQIKLPAVCLEHGKPNPRAKIPYALRPLDGVTRKQGVYDLCRMLGEGRISQRTAQAAAWRLCNDMSWTELAAKKVDSLLGPAFSRPFFTRQELKAAKAAAESAVAQAEHRRTADGSEYEIAGR